MARTITIADSITWEIAEKIVEQAHPGYSKDAQGEWYVVDGVQVVHAERRRPWYPWPEDAEVISVDDLVFEFGGAGIERAEFSMENDAYADDDLVGNAISFARNYVPDSYNAESHAAQWEV